MLDWIASLTDTTGFIPRRQCGAWTEEWVAVHTGSDVLIWLAYLSIPLVLLSAFRHPALRRFRYLVVLFAAFILACGTIHLIEAVIFSHPIYRLSGVVKAITALVSWATVFALIPAAPRILDLLDRASPATPVPMPMTSEREQPRSLMYVMAILVALLALLIRYALDPLVNQLHPYLLCLLAVTFVSWYGGFLPGMATLGLSGFAATYLFVEPRYTLFSGDLNQQMGIGLFLVGGVGVAVLGETQRRTRAALFLKVSQLWAATDAVSSEKRKAEEALGVLDAFVRNSPVGIAFLDADLKFLRVNDTFAHTNGLTGQSALGRPLPEVIPDFPPDVVTEFSRVLNQEDGVSSRLMYRRMGVWETTAFPVPMGDSRMGLGVICVDVSARHNQETRLKESETRFRQLADAMPQIVFAARPDGHVDYFNRRWYEYTGFPNDGSTGDESWVDVHEPDALEKVANRWGHSIRTGEQYQIEYRLRRADGAWRWHLGRALPVRDDAGQIVRWYGTNTDIDDQKQQQSDLNESRRFVESVLHSLSSHLVVIAADGRILAVNDAWQRFGESNGLPPDYIWIGQSYFEAGRADALSTQANDGIRTVIRGESPLFEIEYPCHGGGVERYFLLRATRFHGDGPVRVVVTHEDVTARVRAERSVRESASQLLQITEAMPLLMWTCQPSGECDYLSRQWVEYTGTRMEDQLGRKWIQSVHPADRLATNEAWQAALSGTADYQVEYRLRRHDGEYRWFAVRGIPLRDRTGHVVRWYGSCTDIHDRILQEMTLEGLVVERTAAIDLVNQELRQQQIFLDAILNNVSEGIVACGPSGQLKLFNAATRRMHGIPEEPLPPDRWAEFYQLYEADGVTPLPTDRIPLVRAWKGEQVTDAELVIRANDQPDRYVQCSGEQLRGADGSISGAVVSMRDMTERREYERKLVGTAAALRVSNDELEKFAYVASHDLQEPLRKIQAFGTRLSDKFRDTLGEQGKDYIDRMLDSTGRMRQLINDLLAFSRVNTKPIQLVPLDLGSLIRDVLSDLDDLVQRTHGRVEVGELPTVEGDPSQLRRVFQNLIGNALKFSRPDVAPVVQVSSVRFEELGDDASPPPPEGGGWRITITDNGIGFDPVYAERIFELFQRLHSRTQYEGTGLGLAIVRKIIQRHGAAISALGRPGDGAAFLIDWPTRAPI